MREVSASPVGGTDGGQRLSGLRARPAWVDEMLSAPVAAVEAEAPEGNRHGHHDHGSHGGGACGACAPEAPCAEHAAAAPAATAGWHDGGVGTVSLRAAGPLDLARLRAWLDGLLWERDAAGGADVLRLKGVLHVDRSPRMHLLQAVYETYDVVEGPAWGEGPGGTLPLSRLVVIGRRLRRAALQAALDGCVVDGGGGGGGGE
jgi:G3E family GTPase